MKQILIFILSATLFSCSNSSSGSNNDSASAASNNSIEGTWVYVNPSSTNSVEKGFGAIIEGNKIIVISMYVYQQTAGYKIYFRRYEGTFVKEGDLLNISYTYETCNPVGKDSFLFKQNGNTATVSNQEKSVVVSVTKYGKDDPNSPLNFTMIEDKDCTIMAKLQLETKNKRSIASSSMSVLQAHKILSELVVKK